MGAQHWRRRDEHRCEIGDVTAQVEPDQVTPRHAHEDTETRAKSGPPFTQTSARSSRAARDRRTCSRAMEAECLAMPQAVLSSQTALWVTDVLFP